MVFGCDANRATTPLTGVSPLKVPARSSRTAVALNPYSPFGIDFMGNHVNDNSTTTTRAAQLMAQAGVRFARITVYWDAMERGPSNGLHWDSKLKTDTLINALLEAGIEPYITLESTACYAISRYADSTCGSFTHHPPDTDAHWQAWATYVQEMVQAFPQVHYWGIWNEPNSRFLVPWSGDRLTAYRRLVRAASPIIRAAGGKVIGPDLGNGDDSLNVPVIDAKTWLENFMTTDGSLVDIVAVHYYGGLTVQDYVQTMSTLASVSGGKEMWLTEVARGDWEKGITDADQANNLATVYRAMLTNAVPQWKKTFYFNAGQFDSLGNAGIVHDLGLPSQSPRPAYDTLKAISGVWHGLKTTLSHDGGFDAMIVEPGNYTFTATTSGGDGNYTYNWEVRWGSGAQFEQQASTLSSFTLWFSCPQYYDQVTVRVVVYDGSGNSGSSDEQSFAVDTRESSSCTGS